jgi:hypothetical protein
VERNLGRSEATSVGWTPELDADFTKNFWLNKETGFWTYPVEHRYIALIVDNWKNCETNNIMFASYFRYV